MKEYTGYSLIDVVFANNINGTDFREIDEILDRGVDINYQDKYGRTPLICAARGNKIKIFKHLISKGADPFLLAGTEDIIDYCGWRANQNEVYEWLNKYDTQKYLLEKHPKLYFMFKKHKILDKKIKKEYEFLTTINNLNLI
jgi:ankyrin repeat protein